MSKLLDTYRVNDAAALVIERFLEKKRFTGLSSEDSDDITILMRELRDRWRRRGRPLSYHFEKSFRFPQRLGEDMYSVWVNGRFVIVNRKKLTILQDFRALHRKAEVMVQRGAAF